MKTKYIFLIAMGLVAVSIFSQTRDDIRVYVAPVVATPEQAAYFRENFIMETIGAGYSIAETADEADYTLNLEVKPNMILYDDGTEEPAPPDEDQFILSIALLDNENNTEIVAFAFPFTELEEMNQFNLFLLYEAMANVPLTKLSAIEIVEESEAWRNKWLYLRAAFSYPIMFYQLKLDPVWGNCIVDPDDPNYRHTTLDHKVRPIPGFLFGLEFQYLNWMSTELVFEMSFGDPVQNSFVPGIGLQLKFPIKPSSYFMLEPYLAISSTLNTSNTYAKYPNFEVGGGFQFGVKGGSMGAFVIDASFMYSIGEIVTYNNSTKYPEPKYVHWNHWTVGLSVGYKIGFFDRLK
jgi:hypothetical protein